MGMCRIRVDFVGMDGRKIPVCARDGRACAYVYAYGHAFHDDDDEEVKNGVCVCVWMPVTVRVWEGETDKKASEQ